jgi:hypothetical protein
MVANGSGYDSCLRQAGRCDFNCDESEASRQAKVAVEIDSLF